MVAVCLPREPGEHDRDLARLAGGSAQRWAARDGGGGRDHVVATAAGAATATAAPDGQIGALGGERELVVEVYVVGGDIGGPATGEGGGRAARHKGA